MTHPLVPMPDNETERLRALHRFDFLRDPSSEPAFRAVMDEICELARTMICADRANLALVFDEEQMFVGRANYAYVHSSREISFAAHAILDPEPFLVADATQDPRFSDNPFVTGPDHVQFYGGFPLEWQPGVLLGALAVYHCEPRVLADNEIDALRLLARLAVDKLRALLTEREMRAHGALLKQTEELAQVGSWELDVATSTITWSAQMYRLHEIEPGAEVTLAHTDALYSGESGTELRRLFTEVAVNGGRFEHEFSFFTARGNLRHGVMIGEAEGAAGAVTRVIGTLYDVTYHRETEEKLAAASMYDALTALPNRSLFERRLAELDETESGSLVVVGLDDLQVINEIRGRDVGNRLLREAAYRLVAAVGTANSVARLGDYEFACFLHHAATPIELSAYQTVIQQAFVEPFRGSDEEVSTTVSLGFAVVEPEQDAVVALSGAEIALHHARSTGKQGVAHFAPELRLRRQKEVALLAEIRRSVARGEFILHYQPICDVTGKGRGFEALMRWNHPTRGVLSPFHFMSAFSDPDLSVALGDVALREAVKQMRAWRDAGLDFGYVAVNLATAQFSKPDFVGEVSSLLRTHGIEPSALVLEVTETVYLDARAECILSVLNGFRAAGISLALDDFGTGHASLTHLRQFPVDKIKIDQSFVRDLEQNAGDAEIVRAVVSLGRSLGMQVVAEGVETAQQLAFLRGLGCDLIQGYYFSKPQPAADLTRFCSPRTEPASAPPSSEPTPSIARPRFAGPSSSHGSTRRTGAWNTAPRSTGGLPPRI